MLYLLHSEDFLELPFSVVAGALIFAFQLPDLADMEGKCSKHTITYLNST